MLGDRDRDNGALTGVFSIANEGPKTVFSEDRAAPTGRLHQAIR